MAFASDAAGNLVVRNTFLEFSLDEPAMTPLTRPRVVSDMTDLRLPSKVQYQHYGANSLAPPPSPMLGTGTITVTKTPIMSPAATPLMTVSEEPTQLFLPGQMMPGTMSYLSGTGSYQVYAPQTSSPWSMMGAQLPSISGMTGPSLPYSGVSPTLGSTTSYMNMGYLGGTTTYQAPTPSANSYSMNPGNLGNGLPLHAQARSSTMPLHAQTQAPVTISLASPSSRLQQAKTPPASSAREFPAADYPGGDPTTVMLRNIPNRYTQGHLVDLLDENGFRSRYDFVYLPMDFRNGVNLGYAFVNLLSHQDALHTMQNFQGFSRWFYDSNKVCEVSWAHPHQGLEEHVERYRNSPVMHVCMPDEYKPMLFKDGMRVPFPPPTKAIRAPKLRPVRERPNSEAMANDKY
jgi:hypothetical protein